MIANRLRYALLTVALVFTGVGVAVAAPSVKLVLSQALLVPHNGKIVAEAVPKKGAKRGETLRLKLVATNHGTSAAYDLQPVGKIDRGEEFVAGSASRNEPVSYSLDGKTFSPRPMIEVKQPDGKTVKKPAPPSDYVAVRWRMKRPLPAKKSVTFTYEVRIR